MDFTTEELKLLEGALAFYEEHGLAAKALADLTVSAFTSIGKSHDEQVRAGEEAAQKLNTRREQIVLLRAKLIRMKDKAFAEEL